MSGAKPTVQTLFFVRAKDPLQTEWAIQPAFSWEGQAGTASIPSWQLNVPAGDFDGIVARLLSAGVERFRAEPIEWEGAKQFFVRDPMGNTVEIYTEPSKE